MAVKVKLRGNQKAMVRFTNQMDEQYFIHILRQHRDDKQAHPAISIKSISGNELPRMPKPMPMPNRPEGIPNVGMPVQPVVSGATPKLVEMAGKGAIKGMEVGIKKAEAVKE